MSKCVKVLHLYAGNLFGGIETFLITLAQQQQLCPEMEHHFGLCFEGRLSKTLQACPAPVHFLGNVRFSRPWTVWQARHRLAALLRTTPFDVVICHACWPQAVFGSVVKAKGLPLVFFAHDSLSGKHWLERFAQKVIPDLAIANSQFTLASLTQFYRQTTGTYIYLPVVAQPRHASQRQQVREQFNLNPDMVVITLVSRLEAWKGHQSLLAALAKLKTLPDWRCWIIGGAQRPHEEAYLAELQTQAQAAGIADRVDFLGQRADVPALLSAADIHCQPNNSPEPFGITFIEALYAGLPVVTTAIGGGQEIVTPDCGQTLRPGDIEGLATTLKTLIAQPEQRAQFSSQAPMRASQLCNPQTQLDRLHQLLIQVTK
jgi:glycosyltransferase involved in cell wall biosynthesis